MVQPPLRAGQLPSQIRMIRDSSSGALNISKDRDYMVSPGSLFQCLTIL